MTMKQRTVGLVVVGVLVAGCGSSGGRQSSGVTTTGASQTVTTEPAASPAATGAGPTSSSPSATDATSTSAVPAESDVPDLLHGASPTGLAVAAIDLRSGMTRWTIPKSADLRGSLGLIGDEPFVFAQSGYCDNNAIIAVDKATGATVWRTPADLQIDESNVGPNLTEMVAGDVLVTTSGGRGSTAGIDIATGAVKWTSDNGAVVAASTSALVTWSTLTGVVSVLDPATGGERWSAPHDQLSAVAAAADADLVYLDVDNALTASDATTGVQRWSATMNGSPSGPANLIRSGDVLLIEESGGITALDAMTGALRWAVPNNSGVEQLSLNDGRTADGNLYLPGPPTVAVINLANGTPRWQMPPEIGPGFGLIAAGGGHVLVQDKNRRLHLMDAATGAELWDTITPTDKRTLGDGATYRLGADTMYLTWSCGGA